MVTPLGMQENELSRMDSSRESLYLNGDTPLGFVWQLWILKSFGSRLKKIKEEAFGI